jgi:hypothetical protein
MSIFRTQPGMSARADSGTGTGGTRPGSTQWPTCFSPDSDAGESWIMNERWLAEAVHCTRLPLPVAASAVMLRSIGIWAAGRDFFSAALATLAMAPILQLVLTEASI